MKKVVIAGPFTAINPDPDQDPEPKSVYINVDHIVSVYQGDTDPTPIIIMKEGSVVAVTETLPKAMEIIKEAIEDAG